MKAIARLGFSFAATLILAGCFMSTKESSESRPTIGRELLDLKQARDANSISDAEFQELKAKIMNSAQQMDGDAERAS